MSETEHILKALANRRRLAIVRFLKRNKQANVGQIAAEMKISFKAVSNHLTRLQTADLVSSEKIGLMVFYRLADKPPRLMERILPFI